MTAAIQNPETKAEPEDHLEAPAGEYVAAPEPEQTPEPEAGWKYPESTERRSLLVAYSEKDKSDKMEYVAKRRNELDKLRADAKASASSFKGRIDKLEAEIGSICTNVREGGENRSVECRWEYECAGADRDGKKIFHPEYKSLFRTDTGALVTTALITPEERQGSLDLPLEESPAGEDTSDEDNDGGEENEDWDDEDGSAEEEE